MTMAQNNANLVSRRAQSQPQAPLWQTALSRLSFGVKNYFAKSKRKAAVRSALIAIANRHPDWADVGFDEHFVANQGAGPLASYYQSGQLPDAATLADAWSNQFRWNSTTRLNTQNRFMPIAEDFVYILSTEDR